MGKIRILNDEIINQIAAGEIVEAPCSALKEIIENSIDANARNIEIFIKDGGKSKIVVDDDGDGIASEEDLRSCVLRHATSKLSGNNLFDVSSYGFRGEALPSIASVSNFSIESNGRGISVDFSVVSDVFSSSISKGTRVCIANMFDKTPVRLKFLKSDSSELAKCVNIVENFSLTTGMVNFVLQTDGKVLLSYRNDSLESRISNIYGKNLFEKTVYFEENDEDISIRGYLFHPNHSKYSSSNAIRLFVNNRIVKDRIVNMAVKIGYRNVIEGNRYPMAVLYINIDPLLIDINISPTKSEIRFRNEQAVQKFLIKTITKNIQQFNKVSLDFDINYLGSSATKQIMDFQKVDQTDGIEQEQLPIKQHSVEPQEQYEKRGTQPPVEQQEQYEKRGMQHSVEQQEQYEKRGTQPPVEPQEQYEKRGILEQIRGVTSQVVSNQIVNDSEKKSFFGEAIAQIFDTYIISCKKETEEIFIIDQHAVHEKMVMNRIMDRAANKDENAQYLMRPEIINISAKQAVRIDRIVQTLTEFGFKIDIVGQGSLISRTTEGSAAIDTSGSELLLVMKAIPSDLNSNEAVKIVTDILSDEDEKISDKKEYVRKRIADVACHNSIRGGRRLSIDEMNSIINDMETAETVFQCNHHRPSFVRISKKDLEKMFERK
jgi:DNA mismatch repair protein MutL